MKKTFNAVRVLTKGNLLFRDKITIDTNLRRLKYHKRNPIGIGRTEVSLHFNQIASFQLITRIEWLFFCNICIETYGGGRIIANGFAISDAKEIKRMLGY